MFLQWARDSIQLTCGGGRLSAVDTTTTCSLLRTVQKQSRTTQLPTGFVLARPVLFAALQRAFSDEGRPVHHHKLTQWLGTEAKARSPRIACRAGSKGEDPSV